MIKTLAGVAEERRKVSTYANGLTAFGLEAPAIPGHKPEYGEIAMPGSVAPAPRQIQKGECKLTTREIFDQARQVYVATENSAVRNVMELVIVRLLREGVLEYGV